MHHEAAVFQSRFDASVMLFGHAMMQALDGRSLPVWSLLIAAQAGFQGCSA
jgi:hypothetical protein